ncbi:hypothetical protein ACFE04_017683 [Oxalis oulophora]
MEKQQRSFSLKPTRFLLFTFTTLSSVIVFIFFSIWIVKSTPSTHSLTDFTNNNNNNNRVEDAILIHTLVTKPQNTSGFTADFDFVKHSTLADDEPPFNGSITNGVKDSDLELELELESNPFETTENATGVSPSSEFEDESQVIEDEAAADVDLDSITLEPSSRESENYGNDTLVTLVEVPSIVMGTQEKKNLTDSIIESAADYKCTVEFYVSHFLVHESKAVIGKKRKPTLRIDAIDRGSSRWRGADILIFNTAHWWSHSKTKSGINYYQDKDQVHPKLDVSIAFRRALMTWSSWVDRYINKRKTQVFFRSSSPSHFSGGQWNSGGHCTEATRPLNQSLGSGISEKNIIVEDVIKQMKTGVTILNVTGLSGYRIDGHPSVYGRKPESSRVQDCSHWCLPGVPDIWNELLYFHLQSKLTNSLR